MAAVAAVLLDHGVPEPNLVLGDEGWIGFIVGEHFRWDGLLGELTPLPEESEMRVFVGRSGVFDLDRMLPAAEH